MICATAAVMLSGCISSSISDRRIARYRPRISDRGGFAGLRSDNTAGGVASDVAGTNTMARVLKRGDKIMIELRGIPVSEQIRSEIDELGVNLPLIGRIKIAEGVTTFDAEKLIEKAYIDGGFYTKINVIVTTQEDEYFIQGEVKMEGKYLMTGDRTLLQAISTAGGYTDFAKKSQVKVIRGQGKDKQILYFDCERIGVMKEKDALIKPGDIIVVPRRWFL
jgi:polysaccharide export outer membrane protein